MEIVKIKEPFETARNVCLRVPFGSRRKGVTTISPLHIRALLQADLLSQRVGTSSATNAGTINSTGRNFILHVGEI